jgi:hypothetical protein
MKIEKPKPSVKNRRMKEWAEIRKRLKIEFESRGIIRCELCGSTFGLSFAHKEKRSFYYGTDKLGDFNSVLLLCIPCHQKLEQSRELTIKIFKKLR